MAAYAKDKGVSLFDMMRDMYVKYGFYKENLYHLPKKENPELKKYSK